MTRETPDPIICIGTTGLGRRSERLDQFYRKAPETDFLIQTRQIGAWSNFRSASVPRADSMKTCKLVTFCKMIYSTPLSGLGEPDLLDSGYLFDEKKTANVSQHWLIKIGNCNYK